MDKSIIAKVQSFGFDVYMRNPEKDTWLLFTDGANIGYLQCDRMSGYSLSTVHVPNQTSGTGFSIEKELSDFDKDDLAKCFYHAPAWADSRSHASVVKWKSIEQFVDANSFNRGYQRLPTVETEQ